MRLVHGIACVALIFAASCGPATESEPPPAETAEAAPSPKPVAAADHEPESLSEIAPGAGVPMAPTSTPPASANGHATGAMPPAAAGDPPPAPAPATMPPTAAGDPPDRAARPPKKKNGHGGSKVLSYFQKDRTRIDTARAFGFVLMPKVAVSDAEKSAQKAFCTTMLASMDFMTPSAVVASTPTEVLPTYWPIVGSRESFEIKDAFTTRNCDELIAWYDHQLARALATKAGVGELTGPLLITWPSTGTEGAAARDPLIVDFSKANQERAKKALQYWFRQVKARPELWSNRIREGTIRAELADAVNDTAGVVLSVLAGKWDSLTVVAAAP